jgi:DNA repair protein RecO (recombination protein O)
VPRRIHTDAIVLLRNELGESDRIITLLTGDQGILRAVAPGARRSRRRFGGCLELFARIEASLTDKGAGRLSRLEEAVLRDSHEAIKSDLLGIAHASYLSELILAFWRERDEAGQAYRLLGDALNRLERGPLSAEELRRFELNVLSAAGFAPSLDACLGCGAKKARQWMFDHDRGGILCRNCLTSGAGGPRIEPVTPSVLRFLQALQKGGKVPFAASPQTRGAARALLGRFIQDHAGRPLRAREFLRQLAGKGKGQGDR